MGDAQNNIQQALPVNPQTGKWWRGQNIALAILLLVIAFAAWKLYDVANDASRGAAVGMITKDASLADNQKDLATLIATNYNEYRTNAKNWSLAYYSCVFLSAILGALAGVVLKLEYFARNEGLKKDVAAILTVSGAILVAFSTNGDFQRKWQSNRIAASGMENLAYDLLKKPFTDDDRTKIVAGIQEINSDRNREIAGEVKPTPKPQETLNGPKNDDTGNKNGSSDNKLPDKKLFNAQE